MEGSSSPRKFSYGDLVWGKMPPWREWPGRVSEPPDNEKPPSRRKGGYPSYWIYFFGSKNYGWVTENCMWLYDDFRDQFLSKGKKQGKQFAAAVEEADRRSAARSMCAQKRKQDEEETVGGSDAGEKMDKDNPVDTEPGQPLQESNSPSEEPPAKKATKESVKRKVQDNPTVSKSPVPPALATDDSISSVQQPSVVINRVPELPEPPEHEAVDLEENDLENSEDAPSIKVGVLGLGLLGGEMASCLLEKKKHDVTVWNRSQIKCAEYVSAGAKKAATPEEVFASCDITLCCVSSPEAVKEIVFRIGGLLSHAEKGHDLVMFTSMDPESSVDISDAITRKGSRYLETRAFRSKPASKCRLTILAAGDEDLFSACSSVFDVVAGGACYLGAPGTAAKAGLIMSTLMGTVIAGLAEAMVLAERTGIATDELLQILEVSPLSAPIFLKKGQAMQAKSFDPQLPLQYIQKDMSYALDLAAKCDHSMPVAAAAKEVYVYAKHLKYGEQDVSALILPARF